MVSFPTTKLSPPPCFLDSYKSRSLKRLPAKLNIDGARPILRRTENKYCTPTRFNIGSFYIVYETSALYTS